MLTFSTYYEHMSPVSTYRHNVAKKYGIFDMSFRPDRPYADLPGLPPQADTESKAVLKACVEARAALAALKVSGSLIPNQAMLINNIPTLEAQASSEIENIHTTADRMFRFASEGDPGTDPATKEAHRYRVALKEGTAALAQKPLTTALAEHICTIIKGVEMTVRKVPGTALKNEKTGKIIYTPPEGEQLLRDKLANWERYIHTAKEIDPLIRMAIMHYQFEAIHPFTDGNGRTGRVLNLLYLVEQGLLDFPILYLSRFIIQNRAAYYQLLLEVTTEGHWESWILYMLKAVEETATWTTAKINAIKKLQDDTAENIKAKAPKIYTHELVETLFAQPYCRIADLVEAGIVQRQQASVYLKSLSDIGILAEQKSGRDKLFINTALLTLLTEG
jgi:Fic family protein